MHLPYLCAEGVGEERGNMGDEDEDEEGGGGGVRHSKSQHTLVGGGWPGGAGRAGGWPAVRDGLCGCVAGGDHPAILLPIQHQHRRMCTFPFPRSAHSYIA